MSKEISDLRREYDGSPLKKAAFLGDPVQQFMLWFEEATKAEEQEANAMTLATVSVDGSPSARLVLLKNVTQEGFSFFTNCNSAKGRDIQVNASVALVFYWPSLNRQVRVEGKAFRVSGETAEQYFRSRPRRSQIAALVSNQSEVVASREVLEKRMRDAEAEFHGADVPFPSHWGGYQVVPEAVEFWQGRRDRLHDRLRYRRSGKDQWILERLAP